MTAASWPLEAPAIGTFVKLPTPEVVEILALAGVDFLVIDNEHAVINPQTISTMIGTARGYGITPFVRVPSHEPRDVQAFLDAGAAGLLLPHVDSTEQARRAVASCRFPPLGTRGVSNSGRAGGWGRTDLPDYLLEGNASITLVAQLESRTALENACAIANTKGIDAVMIGPADLAVSSGLPLGDPELTSLTEETERTCVQGGHTLGTTAPDGPGAAKRFARGYRFVVVATEVALLARAAREMITAARGPLE
ncbi:HpcH/HpaI aldolase/citrate lyase family protein [Streptomyces sp. NPDC127036]|uniref:HpcH/HpaI aldolase family protein n=1 Tax=Streptomyces sp. NPDC127036 TaxID=3347112 RepID=UPI00365DFABC